MFAVQNTWEAGVESEEEQGKRLAKVARDKGVQHFVYTSVGSAHRKTGIPHFENKFRVEETVKQLGFPSHVDPAPGVLHGEPAVARGSCNGDKLTTALKPETKLQMVAVDDIGKFGAAAFADADKFKGAEIDIAGDARHDAGGRRGDERALGKTITYQQIPIEAVRAEQRGLRADARVVRRGRLQRRHPVARAQVRSAHQARNLGFQAAALAAPLRPQNVPSRFHTFLLRDESNV